MKKTASLIITAALLAAVCFAGCSSDNGSASSAPAEKDNSAAASAESTEEKESSAEESEEASEDAESSEELPAGEPVDASWFDDAVFVGDSVTLKLSYYSDNGSLGDAIFFCEGSLGWNNALWDLDHEDNVHPSYEGVKYTVDEGIAAIGRKNVFIMLGMNDIGLYGVDGGIEAMKELTDKIVEKSPDVKIYIESVTPMLVESQLTDLNNENIRKFDEQLKQVCEEKGYTYLNVYSAVENESGDLVPEYCGDPDAMGLHFSDEGCAQWVEYLKNNVNA